MKDKIIWITGASSGIGEALAYAYAEAGARLILSARNRDELFRVKQQCRTQAHVHVLPLDLEDTDALASKAANALNIYGRIDVLINSGGISQRGLALQTGNETEQRIMNVNFWGTVALSKAVLPAMISAGSGQLVCISSIAGKLATKNRSAYAASKHALHGYFDALRSEVFKDNIRVTIICPGYIKTNISLNALTASGEVQGTMDENQANGMSASACAAEIIKAIAAGKEEVYIGGRETIAVWLKRLFPGYLSKKLRNREN
ncbi:SDR family oxidoreductase [Pedobacter sp. SYP-B3415]|uniref:SDR family oxidoreductase n=1 Tax=Pedobacter sp. SYP-B3415 TaxID=2496641 RepID=UPI00101B8849|nr:SDR family oxidoreductase [Pedobacter sp. SYP-B3415]